MDAPVEVDALPHQLVEQPDFRVLQLSDLSFGYPESEKLSLNKVSLELTQGKQMAVVGPSGGGKSTLFKLLLGFYKPDEGEISINGQPIGGMPLEQLRSYFAYVPQESGLYTEASVTISRAASRRQRKKRLLKRCGRRMLMSS